MAKQLDPMYFRNPKGHVGISLDEGETLMIPMGKVVRWFDVWEEVSDDLDGELSPVQAEYLKAHLAKPPMTVIEEMAWKLRQARRHDAKAYATPPMAHTILSDAVVVVASDPDVDDD